MLRLPVIGQERERVEVLECRSIDICVQDTRFRGKSVRMTD